MHSCISFQYFDFSGADHSGTPCITDTNGLRLFKTHRANCPYLSCLDLQLVKWWHHWSIPSKTPDLWIPGTNRWLLVNKTHGNKSLLLVNPWLQLFLFAYPRRLWFTPCKPTTPMIYCCKPHGTNDLLFSYSRRLRFTGCKSTTPMVYC